MSNLEKLKKDVLDLSNLKAMTEIKKVKNEEKENENNIKIEQLNKKMEEVATNILFKNEISNNARIEEIRDINKKTSNDVFLMKQEVVLLNNSIKDVTHLNDIYELKKKEIDKSILEQEQFLEMLKNDRETKTKELEDLEKKLNEKNKRLSIKNLHDKLLEFLGIGLVLIIVILILLIIFEIFGMPVLEFIHGIRTFIENLFSSI